MSSPFEAWVHRALAKWPNVPALFGWLALDRRGRWRIRGEVISRAQIIDTINANYAADAQGRWFFQNGPQRGYMQLEYAPLVLHGAGEDLVTHTQRPVTAPRAAYLDEQGALLVDTEHGAGLVAEDSLAWALERMTPASGSLEAALDAALALPSGASTSLVLRLPGRVLPLQRLDADAAPAALGFVREPAPVAGEA